MGSLTQLVLVVFACEALLVTRGCSLPFRNAGRIVVISKADIGSILKNVTIKSCNDNTILNFSMKQTSYRPPVFSVWIQFVTLVDVFSMETSGNILFEGKEIFTGVMDNYHPVYQYLPIFKNEVRSILTKAPNIGLMSLPKGHYTSTVTAVNQDEIQFACFHFAAVV